MAFDTPLSTESMYKVIRIRLFEMGHSFEYIDTLSLKDISDIVGYWTGKSLAEKRLSRKR